MTPHPHDWIYTVPTRPFTPREVETHGREHVSQAEHEEINLLTDPIKRWNATLLAGPKTQEGYHWVYACGEEIPWKSVFPQFRSAGWIVECVEMGCPTVRFTPHGR